VANQVLDLFPEPQPHLQGLTNKSSQIVYSLPEDRYTVLCRSNAGLLGEALSAIRAGKKIHVIGSLMESILLMESAWYLSIGETERVRHPMMQMAGTWEAVQEMAKEDQDFRMAVKRVEEYHSSIPYLCEELKLAGETSRERADVVLSTVHKAKGDEFESVKLGEDFPDLIRWSKKERRYVPQKAELCIFFVAVTRAKERLYANSLLPQLRTWKELL
jgi:superfamily I DNA/RNA helicase